MLLTRARTRASARGHRLPAGWQLAGWTAASPAPRPGSFRFVSLDPRLAHNTMI